MIIKNAKVITFDDNDRIIHDGGIQIDGEGKILKIFEKDDIPIGHEMSEVIDAQGKYLMPAGICAHTHFYGTFSRGMYIPGEAPAAFPQILEKLWWRLDKSLNKEAIYFSALVCLIDAIRNGTTTLFDHHASPNYILHSLDTIAEAVSKAGLRTSLCYETTDRDGIERAELGIEENIRFIEKIKGNDNNPQFLNATFGLHASLTLSEDTLQKAVKRCPLGFGFHIHVAEHPVDEYDSRNKSGMRVVERLDRLGILRPQTILVHGVHISLKEAMLIAERGAWLTHQPRSNMNNAVGLPRIEELIDAGVKVCLGNDGFSNSMWAEWKSAYLAHKLWNHDPRFMPADTIKKMAIDNNRNMAHDLMHGVKIGTIENGYSADLILVDYQPFTELNKDNLPWHIVFGFQDGMVTDTMVQGRFLMRDRKFTDLDESQIVKEAQIISKQVWKRYHAFFD